MEPIGIDHGGVGVAGEVASPPMVHRKMNMVEPIGIEPTTS
jgi:hypothetical protein